MKVSLSILTVNYGKVMESIAPLIDKIEYLHLDVMDGSFVPNISFGPAFVKSLRPEIDKAFDTHLMISNPLEYIKDFALAGSDFITFHLEANSDILATIEEIRSFGKKVGLSIKPKTDVKKLIPYLSLVDLVLIMSVEPGFGGQSFMPNAADKIAFLADYRQKNNLNYLVSVDGGINGETAKIVKKAGADFSIVGSYILNDANPIQKITEIEHI